MTSFSSSPIFSAAARFLLMLTAFVGIAGEARAWWNPEWTIRKKITVDTTPAGGAVTDPIGGAVILVRLFEGNFQFASAKEDGGDIRFIAADDKTVLKHHLERFDSLLFEAYAWVKVPDVAPGAQTTFWLYYGNANAEQTNDAKGTYDADTALVYHFSETGAPADSSPGGNPAENAGTPATGSLIAGGLRLTGSAAVKIPASPSLAWTEGGAMTWSAWIKPTSLQPGGILFSRRDGDRGLVIGVDNGVPFVEVIGAASPQRSSPGEALAVNVWHHLAVVATGAQLTLSLDGERYATVNAGLPALNSVSSLGKDTVEAGDRTGFDGELDELQIAKTVRPPGWIKLNAISQSDKDKAAKLLVLADDETAGGGAHGGGGLIGHVQEFATLLFDISKSLTIEGWVVIFLCTVLALIGWVVAIAKFFYLLKIKKATDTFLKQWEHLSTDLTALDHGDEESIKSMGGKASGKSQKLMRQSPLYHIYHIGSMEIRHRIENAREGFKGLSGRSITAIKSTLDGGLVREIQRLNRNLVFLTIGIAGGPYLGLLGTVIGVMITFAVIAKSGEVEVNSIAPGIAGALLATVAGLAVAIPALFAYSYISSQIKDAISGMHVFIDEFVAKIAEFYPTAND
jgi:biopolymer transport protein ExbB